MTRDNHYISNDDGGINLPFRKDPQMHLIQPCISSLKERFHSLAPIYYRDADGAWTQDPREGIVCHVS